MHCEGEKVYTKPGDCPVCNMHLVPQNNSEKGKAASKKSDKKDDGPVHDHSKHTANTSKQGKYYCPMHCEGDKTYEKPGDCPVCGMHLNKEESISHSKVIYTCPMHPEVKQDHPGDCPKCGMTLVPEKGVEKSEEQKEPILCVQIDGKGVVIKDRAKTHPDRVRLGRGEKNNCKNFQKKQKAYSEDIH